MLQSLFAAINILYVSVCTDMPAPANLVCTRLHRHAPANFPEQFTMICHAYVNAPLLTIHNRASQGPQQQPLLLFGQVGGIVLHKGNIAEMKTGEGKTLVATLPAYLNALTGKGVHVVTVNDYLAERDANW